MITHTTYLANSQRKQLDHFFNRYQQEALRTELHVLDAEADTYFSWYCDSQGEILSVLFCIPIGEQIQEARFFTAPQHRQKGYARALLEAYRTQNYAKLLVMLPQNHPNTLPFRFHEALEKLGFLLSHTEYLMMQKTRMDFCDQQALSLLPGNDFSFYRSIYLSCFSDGVKSEKELLAELDEDAFAAGETYLIQENHICRMYSGEDIRLGHRNEIVGCVILSPQGNTTFLSCFGILPSKRKKGRASAVLQMLLRDDRFAPSISLQVSSQNIAAKSLYDKNGFETMDSVQVYIKM